METVIGIEPMCADLQSGPCTTRVNGLIKQLVGHPILHSPITELYSQLGCGRQDNILKYKRIIIITVYKTNPYSG